ncbi:MAG: hypothetical protein U0791_21715 [Gemmataceae bacterium]
MQTIPCRAILLFAMKREAEPLIARLQPAWLEEFRTFAFLRSIPDPADVLAPTADDVIFDFTGIGRAAARRTILRLLERFHPGRVIAAGYCGALVAGLNVGDVVESPHIHTADGLVGDPAEKTRLAAETGARAVDMESAAIAEVCSERGLPFTAIRAVSDTRDTALSPQLVRLLSGGEISIAQACLALLRKPSLLREFLRLRRDTKLAAENLAVALLPHVSPVA